MDILVMAEFKETKDGDSSYRNMLALVAVAGVLAAGTIVWVGWGSDYAAEALEPRIIEREVIVEKPVEKIVYRNNTVAVPVEVIKEKIVNRTVEVEKPVPFPVYVNHTIIREVPVEKIVEIEKPVIVEKEKIVYVEVPVYLPAPDVEEPEQSPDDPPDNSTSGGGNSTGGVEEEIPPAGNQTAPEGDTASIILKAFRVPSEHWGETFVGAGAQMYFAVYDATGAIAAQGFFDENGHELSLVKGQSYWAYPADCEKCHDSDHDVVFAHWGNGSNDRPRAFVAGELGELHASYQYIPSS